MAKTTTVNVEAVRQGMRHLAKKVTGPIKKQLPKKENPAVRNVATRKNAVPKRKTTGNNSLTATTVRKRNPRNEESDLMKENWTQSKPKNGVNQNSTLD